MTIIGITGGFGTGKTTAAGFFKELGAVVFDADKIAHAALLKKCASYKMVVKIFGKKILKRNKEIDRKKLANIVFSASPAEGGQGGSAYGGKLLLHRLNKIIHPYVIRKIKEGIEGIREKNPNAIVVLDIPLLVEAGLVGEIDKLIVVKTGRKTQLERCQKNTHLNKKEILARIRAQMPISEKIRIADFIIDNGGTKEQTKREVEKIWEQIQLKTFRKKRII